MEKLTCRCIGAEFQLLGIVHVENPPLILAISLLELKRREINWLFGICNLRE